MAWMPDGEKCLKICVFVLTECTNVTDTQTDRRTPHDDIGRACISSRGKNERFSSKTAPDVHCCELDKILIEALSYTRLRVDVNRTHVSSHY